MRPVVIGSQLCVLCVGFCFFLLLFFVFEVAFATEGLVFIPFAQEYAAVAVDKSVGVVGYVAALDADGVYFG